MKGLEGNERRKDVLHIFKERKERKLKDLRRESELFYISNHPSNFRRSGRERK